MGISVDSAGKKVKKFSYNEIKNATENFKDLLDNSGGNGVVHKGRLDDGTNVAVKRPISNGENPINHMINEINIHAEVKHIRIVRLIGYCPPPQLCIVYEYMSRGNLFNHLHRQGISQDGTFLSWQQRITIARQVSEALAHLHNHGIYHVDVKSANILLDDNFNAKLSDFGHSQKVKSVKSHKSMPVVGTPHLRDPYWKKTGKLTNKTDVYCFGLLLVELLTSKKIVELDEDNGVILVKKMELMKELLTSKKIVEPDKDNGVILVKKMELMKEVDPLLKKGMTQVVDKQMVAIWSLAVECTSHQIEYRPSMEEVAKQIGLLFSSHASLY